MSVTGSNSKGWNKLMHALNGLDKRTVKVGILEKSGGGRAVDGGGDMTLAGVGAIHEYGTLYAQDLVGGQLIPARRWLRGTFELHAKEFRSMQRRIVASVFKGTVPPHNALGLLGTWAANKVKFHVKSETIEPDITQATKDAKGSSRPLVDTGLMVNAVTYEIENGKSNMNPAEVSVGSEGTF